MSIKVAITVKDSLERVWGCFTETQHIKEWYHAADTWFVPSAESDFRVGGKFKTRMAAMDKSGAFDFAGTFTNIVPHEKICFTLDDDRKVMVTFEADEDGVHIVEQFDPTPSQPHAAQQMGWELILRSFKNYVEN